VTVVVRSREELAKARHELDGSIGLVPTMGALHAGHLANIAAAQAQTDATVVSIFVNPMQFDQAADLQRYPRPLEDDLRSCEQAGVDLVWAPDVDTVYQHGLAKVWITGGELANQLEGPNRPGHFDGVLTVVAKLFSSIRPDHAYFGEKDYQQLTLVRRMAADLDLGVAVHGVATVRDPDGLALSSRNVFLSAAERAQALGLSRALQAGRDGGGGPAAVLARARAELAGVSGIEVEYLELRDPDLGPAPERGPARLLVAGWVGKTRLIDNIAIELGR
jgi:pantoate--beta-alanine ligase